MNRLQYVMLTLLALMLMVALSGCGTREVVVVTATPDPEAAESGSEADSEVTPEPDTEQEQSAGSGEETASDEGVSGIPDVSLGPFDPSFGRIAYMGPTSQNGPFRAFVVNADGSGLTPLSEGSGESIFPSLSPDGNRVAYAENDGQSTNIFVTDLATEETEQLTDRSGMNIQPLWSPDGSQIAFVTGETREDGNLWLMEADGSNPRPLVEMPGFTQLGSWSPDGSRITFSLEDGEGNASLWIVDVASGETSRVTERKDGIDSGPAWSPDGETIAFYSGKGQRPYQLMTIRPDGTERRAITDGSYPTMLPVWSPDGEWLLYTMMPSQNQYDLVALNLESKKARIIENVQGFATAWREVDEPLAETDHTQGPKMSGVEIDPEVLADAPRMGDADAPVTIVEFSDYECPYCHRWQQTTLPELEPYIEDGTVQLIYVDYPLKDIHPAAGDAAESAHCVAEQGGKDVYWEFHNLLFENQSKWKDRSQTETALQELATEVGVDGDEVLACMESDRHLERIEAGAQEAARLGVTGTPTFFVNGNRLQGAQPFSAFEQFLP